jgi:hypothetical protein
MRQDLILPDPFRSSHLDRLGRARHPERRVLPGRQVLQGRRLPGRRHARRRWLAPG